MEMFATILRMNITSNVNVKTLSQKTNTREESSAYVHMDRMQ